MLPGVVAFGAGVPVAPCVGAVASSPSALIVPLPEIFLAITTTTPPPTAPVPGVAEFPEAPLPPPAPTTFLSDQLLSFPGLPSPGA